MLKQSGLFCLQVTETQFKLIRQEGNYLSQITRTSRLRLSSDPAGFRHRNNVFRNIFLLLSLPSLLAVFLGSPYGRLANSSSRLTSYWFSNLCVQRIPGTESHWSGLGCMSIPKPITWSRYSTLSSSGQVPIFVLEGLEAASPNYRSDWKKGNSSREQLSGLHLADGLTKRVYFPQVKESLEIISSVGSATYLCHQRPNLCIFSFYYH